MSKTRRRKRFQIVRAKGGKLVIRIQLSLKEIAIGLAILALTFCFVMTGWLFVSFCDTLSHNLDTNPQYCDWNIIANHYLK